MKKQFCCPDGKAWLLLAIAGGLIAGLATNVALAQVAAPRVWPATGRDLWYWLDPKTDYAPEQVADAFAKAIAEEMAFLDPAFGVSVFFAKHIRVTGGKAGARKKYQDRPEKADNLRIETEWRTGDMNQYRGSSYCFIPLDSIRGMDLHYLPDARERFPKAPESRNWNVNILTGPLYNFFFGTEDAARNFINAVASLLKQRGLGITFSRFGLMWENVTPDQAADMGRALGEGVLVTEVAVAGPADRAGIRPLDAVLEVNGAKVKNFSHFSLLLDGIAAGSKGSLLLLRRLKDPEMNPGQKEWNTLTTEMEAR
jgi:hypothetical protein